MLIENLVIYTRRPFQDMQGRMVYHGYPIANEDDHYVAQHWAGWNNSNDGALSITHNGFPVFKDLIITSLHHRGSGGRALQVLIPIDIENAYVQVDLREDTLMEVIFKKGIEAGGKMNGEFAFAKNGSQIKLLLVGSKDYETAKEKATRKTKMKKISNKDLKVGYEYATIKGEPYIYLGAYYQHEDLSTSVINHYSKKPVLHHVFYDKKREFPIFRKSHVFTIESEAPVITEEVAKQTMENYVKQAYRRFLEVLGEIEEVYLKYYDYQEGNPNMTKEQAVRMAESRAKVLTNVAYESYRQYATTLSKEECNFDKPFIRTMVTESKEKAVENVSEYNFL